MTTDVADTSAETESAVSTPPSDGVLEQPSTQEVVPDAQGEETPETGEEQAEVRTPDSYNLQELNQLLEQGKLNDPSLVQRWKSLDQSEKDRQAREQENLATARANEQARLQQIAQAGQNVRAQLASAYQTEIDRAAQAGRDPDFELIKERQERILGDYERVTGAIHLEPHRTGVREALLRVNGDTAQNRKAYAAMDLPDLMVELYNSAFAKGKQAPPSDDHVVMTKKDFEQAQKDYAKAELDKTLKARGLGSASSTAGTNGAVVTNIDPRSMTIEQYEAWKQNTTEAERRRVWTGG